MNFVILATGNSFDRIFFLEVHLVIIAGLLSQKALRKNSIEEWLQHHENIKTLSKYWRQKPCILYLHDAKGFSFTQVSTFRTRDIFYVRPYAACFIVIFCWVNKNNWFSFLFQYQQLLHIRVYAIWKGL